MYKIGDKIVYPMHGAGVISAIEEKEILGKKQKYYVMKMPVGDMKVMVPMEGAENIGIRDIISKDTCHDVIEAFKNCIPELNSNWNKRYRENMEKIRGGNIFDVAEVVKALLLRDSEKVLSAGERKMLSSAKQILISEIVLSLGLTAKEVETTLLGLVKQPEAR